MLSKSFATLLSRYHENVFTELNNHIQGCVPHARVDKANQTTFNSTPFPIIEVRYNKKKPS